LCPQGGGGWRKIFNFESLPKILTCISKDILRAFQKNKSYYDFNPEPEKVSDIVSSNHLKKCAPGESYRNCAK
jgi:hypothetical protein